MKRLALLLASATALILFTACPDNKPTDEYYSEEIALNYKFRNGNDTTFHFTQEFTLVGNTMIYDPASSINRDNPYINFRYGTTCSIIHDSVLYINYLDASNRFINNYFPPITAKLDYAGKKKKDFSFSYILHEYNGFVISAHHTCHCIDRLSD